MIRRSRSMIATSLGATVLALVLAVPAPAAIPFDAGFGNEDARPQVAVGADGVGHVVWSESPSDGSDDRVGYCRVRRNATACDRTTHVNFPPSELKIDVFRDAPQVFAPAPGKVVILGGYSAYTNAIFRWISTDNGASFGAPVKIAETVYMTAGAYVESGDVAVAMGNGNDEHNSNIVAGPTAPTTPSRTVLPSGDSPSVVRVPGQNQLVAVNSSNSISFSVFSGALTAASINTGTWSGAQPTTPGETYSDPSLGAGGAGVFLTFRRFAVGAPEQEQIIAQRYDPATKQFEVPKTIVQRDVFEAPSIDGPPPVANVSNPDIAVDSSGPHVIWDSHFGDSRLRYRRSTDGGATYGPVLNLALHGDYDDPQIAVAPDGSGFATWTEDTFTVQVVALDPQPEPSSGPPPPPPPPPPPAKDTTRPLLSALSLSPSRFAAARKGASIVRRGGSRVSYRLSEPGVVKFTVQRADSGRRAGGRCVKAKRSNRRARRCTRYRRLRGSFTHPGAGGQNSFKFSGRLRNRKLAPGRYRLQSTATDAAGNRSRPERTRFQIRRR